MFEFKIIDAYDLVVTWITCLAFFSLVSKCSERV